MLLPPGCRATACTCNRRTDSQRTPYSFLIADHCCVSLHTNRCVDDVHNGEQTGSEFGLWALIINNKPGGVGYSGRGAGADEGPSDVPVPSTSQLYVSITAVLFISALTLHLHCTCFRTFCSCTGGTAALVLCTTARTAVVPVPFPRFHRPHSVHLFAGHSLHQVVCASFRR